MSLLDFKKKVFSQKGEDGIISHLFGKIGTTSKKCGEVGAWDGVHLSNTRQLILNGWGAILIEKDRRRFATLTKNYSSFAKVRCVCQTVRASDHTLDRLFKKFAFANLDFLSIDIDGLDYEVWETLKARPRLVCVEVNSLPDPESVVRLPKAVAEKDIGQPLGVFCEMGKDKGYELIAYTGNAFYLRADLCRKYSFSPLTPRQAYEDYLDHLSPAEREWLYLASHGLVHPFRRLVNPFFDREKLAIPLGRAISLLLGKYKEKISRSIK